MSAPQTSEQMAAEKRAKTDKRRYVALRLRGSGPKCIADPVEARAMMFDDADLTGEDVWMTVAEFEALPDFGGF